MNNFKFLKHLTEIIWNDVLCWNRFVAGNDNSFISYFSYSFHFSNKFIIYLNKNFLHSNLTVGSQLQPRKIILLKYIKWLKLNANYLEHRIGFKF